MWSGQNTMHHRKSMYHRLATKFMSGMISMSEFLKMTGIGKWRTGQVALVKTPDLRS